MLAFFDCVGDGFMDMRYELHVVCCIELVVPCTDRSVAVIPLIID